MAIGSSMWKFKSVPRKYWEEASKKIALADEKYAINYIKKSGPIKVVSLGIGPGRELVWLDKLKNVKEVIGVDYSQPMLNFCKKVTAQFRLKVTLIKDNLLTLKKLRKVIEKESTPLFYICLINTLGNFPTQKRIKVLKTVREIMKVKDRLILCLDKRPEKRKGKVSLPFRLKIKNGEKEKRVLSEVLEYSSFALFWDPVIKKQYRLPRFWYDEKENDIVIYVGGKKFFISHRFSKEEIKKLCQKAKLKIERLIEGKFMWIVILKT